MNNQQPKQLTEPVDYPLAEIEALSNAINAANAAMLLYFKSRNIELGEQYFSVCPNVGNADLLKSAHEYDLAFLHNVIPLVAAKPAENVQ